MASTPPSPSLPLRSLPLASLGEKGLNLQAVFNIEDLPAQVKEQLSQSVDDITLYSRLILIGHGGTDMWAAVQSEGLTSKNPIDASSIRHVSAALKETLNEADFAFVFPGNQFPGLQDLGTLAGWHHTSPLRIGINGKWGTWFAYRAAVVTTSHFEPTKPMDGVSPCQTCTSRACITACPAKAVGEDGFQAKTCFQWRASDGSPCKEKCPARLACPVGQKHTYSDDQMAYHYGLSLKSIEKMYKS